MEPQPQMNGQTFISYLILNQLSLSLKESTIKPISKILTELGLIFA